MSLTALKQFKCLRDFNHEYVFFSINIILFYVDNCQNVGVVFEDVVAVCEVMNCKKMQVQTTGLVGKCIFYSRMIFYEKSSDASLCYEVIFIVSETGGK